MQIPLDKHKLPVRIEELAPECTLNWYENGIVSIHITTNEREVVDLWTQRFIDIRRSKGPNQSIYLLLDVHDAKANLNPYARTKAVEIMRTRPDVPSFTAVILPRNPIALLLVTFSKTLNALNPNGQMMFCYTHDEAWRWLVGCIEQDKRESSLV